MAQMFRSGLYIYAIMQRSKDEPNLTKAANLPKILQAQLCLAHDKFRKTKKKRIWRRPPAAARWGGGGGDCRGRGSPPESPYAGTTREMYRLVSWHARNILDVWCGRVNVFHACSTLATV